MVGRAKAQVGAKTGAVEPRPYPPSWADQFLGWLERLPGPTWRWFGVLAITSVGFVLAVLLAIGRDPLDISLRFTALGLTPAFSLAMMHHLNRTASEALDRFRPLLDIDDADLEPLRYRLTVLPRGPVAIVWVGTSIATIVNARVAPGNFEIVGVHWAAAVLLIGYACVVGWAYTALVMQIARQLVYIARIHRDARRVDLFDTGPLHAFSQVTSRSALGLLALAAVLAATTLPQFAAASSNELATVAAGTLYVALGIAAVASFVLPLYGLHEHIAREKERLQTQADRRLTSLLQALHADAERLDLSRADGLNKLLASTFEEREILARLPTWPWQAATLRGFVTALILPVAVYVLARATERVVL